MAESETRSGRRTGRRSTGSLIALSVLALACFALLTGLGIWQLRRLEWKLGIIARVESRMQAPAQALPPESVWPALAAGDNEYRKFRLRGTFDHAREIYVFRAAAERQQGPGFHVLTPLRLEGGAHVLVNRGFVPEKLKNPASRKDGQIAGEVTVTGYLRMAEERNSFTPADRPIEKLWYTRDPPAMAQALKLERAPPFVIDADDGANPGGWPRGGTTIVRIRNDHLSYALTWFALALTLLAMFGIFGVRQWRRQANQA